VPQTSTERVAAFRRRQADRLAELELTVSAQAAELAARADRIARLEREREALYATLEASAAALGPSGAPGCPHPAHMVDGDRCGGCGQVVEVW
jgi:hypothetical protein